MFFTATWQDVINGRKNETRRIMRKNMRLTRLSDGSLAVVHKTRDGKTRIKWQVGHTYRVQPARTKQSVARIKVVDLRVEPLHAITENGARAEGVDGMCPMCDGMGGKRSKDGEVWYKCAMCDGSGKVGLVEGFKFLWETVHGFGAWDKNPDVAVIKFEVVEVYEHV